MELLQRRYVVATVDHGALSRPAPLTNAAAAVGRQVARVAHELCGSGTWIGARPLP